MYYCIINPSSRSGKGTDLWGTFEKKFIERKIEYKVIFTKGPGHALETVKMLTDPSNKEIEKPVKLVVLGGDGTMNEVVSGIMDFDNVMLGYIPVGSSNDLARDLSLPSNLEEAMDTILDGRIIRRLDIGSLHYDTMTRTQSRLHDMHQSDKRLFNVSAGIGFDASICEEALSSGTKNLLNKLGLGKLTYGMIAIRQLFTADRISCDIEMDDGKRIHLDHFLFVAIMVHKYEGGGFMFCPNASDKDGMFDICVVGDVKILRALLALPSALKGQHYKIKGIYGFRTRKIKIHTMLPLWVHTDGEVSMKSDTITLECLPAKLSLMM